VRQEQRFATHAGGSRRCFGAGVAAANHQDVEFTGELHRGGEFYASVPRETRSPPVFHVERKLCCDAAKLAS
jgi:hypothetical protein